MLPDVCNMSWPMTHGPVASELESELAWWRYGRGDFLKALNPEQSGPFVTHFSVLKNPVRAFDKW